MRKTLFALIAVCVVAPLGLTGCDREVAQTKTTVTDPNGNVSQQTKTVTQDPAGNRTETKETVINK